MNKQGPNGIGWCDYTWNPIVGCSPISEGCANCYAAAISKRFGLTWGEACFLPQRLGEPEKIKTPSRIFVCSMSDLGHATVREDWRRDVYSAMSFAPWHQYIVLTKRPGMWMQNLPHGIWMGVTIENKLAMDRWEKLLMPSVPGCTRFVSVEPMLEPVTFQYDALRPSWVIAGPETGPKARPCKAEWIDALAAESPCFYDKRENGRRKEFPS